ncbi:VanZ like family protein [Saccharopolyspora antimicrobica]|uniref:VanZ like family protein n=1 Tax=Saccharopolyspora antimicrobica TaxID=455193 RepID=A0A1I4SZB8_9PSEU|nr:VanZ family protein [Saccharopolyspora antimicrobica]RKT85942.1 VanZ like protein [Saccharopolyspora antimicrobica]SFM69761.1 VanZ like family protein [Saccharopolyspora antimicrobica]
MSVLPGSFAVLVATGLAAVLFAPFVAAEHRRHGELRVGVALLRFAALLYATALACYVLLPLPGAGIGFEPQWRPFAGLRNPAVLEQFACNIALFVPLGALLRRGPVAAALVGGTVSVIVELTQLTGTWFLFPVPYRVFDVNDIIANTTGAVLGTLGAPLLRRVPTEARDRPAVPRPVRAPRRLLGMSCDLLLLWWLGVACARAVELALWLTGTAPNAWWEATALWFAPAAVLLAVMLVSGGSSLGQHAVCLRARAPTHPVVAAVLRWTSGIGGFAAVQGVCTGVLGGADAALGVLWCAVHAWGVTNTGDHRGITGRVAGLEVIDARQSQRAPTAARST